jgi:hypothetical protein
MHSLRATDEAYSHMEKSNRSESGEYASEFMMKMFGSTHIRLLGGSTGVEIKSTSEQVPQEWLQWYELPCLLKI